MLDTYAFGEVLEENGFRDFSGVPCSYLAPLINYAINEGRFVMANNEGEAVAIASGVSLAGNSSLGERHSASSDKSGSLSLGGSHYPLGNSFASSLHNPDFSSQILECQETSQDSKLSAISKKHTFGVVLMQNSGLSNALSPLTSLNHTFGIPILGFVSLRGERDEQGRNTDEPQHELLGVITDKLLETCEVAYAFLSADFDEAKKQVRHAREVLESHKSFFFIVRDKTFSKVALDTRISGKLRAECRADSESNVGLESSFTDSKIITESTTLQNLDSQKSEFAHTEPHKILASCDDFRSFSSERAGSYLSGSDQTRTQKSTKSAQEANLPKEAKETLPTRLQALETIHTIATDSQSVLLATTGKCGRELYELGDRDNQLYMVGSMGCVGALGLGIALKSDKKVMVIDGDSALLMRLGALSTNAYYAKMRDMGNFCHILLNNESHDSTGGQFNLSPFVDFCAIARACGYECVYHMCDVGELGEALRAFVCCKSGGAWFVYLRIAKGSKEPLGRPKITPKQVAMRLRGFLAR